MEIFIRDVDTCVNDNEYNGDHFGARISAIFVVLIGSAFGAFFPVLSSKYSFIRLPPICFFIAKFFGSGVIIATAFIHLLQPANENLSNDCLGYPFNVYPIAFAITLIVLMLMFFLELIAYRWIEAKISNQNIDNEAPHTHSHFGDTSMYVNNNNNINDDDDNHSHSHMHEEDHHHDIDDCGLDNKIVHFHENNNNNNNHHHHHHNHNHEENDECSENSSNNITNINMITDDIQDKKDLLSEISDDDNDIEKQISFDSELDSVFAAQLLNVFVLEFGIIFHSIFVGLTLACSGEEFISLYIVVVFHQLFEGLGLGTRIACVEWPKSKRWTPWLLCTGYTFCTPIAIAIGIGVRNSYPPGSRRALITNGVFDSVSAGILIYTGCIELMAHEFLFSDEFKGPGGFKKMIWAYIVMCVGAGLMALLGRWA